MSRLVVLDLDGTLIDSAPLIASLINVMLERRGSARRLTAGEMRPHIMGGAEQTMRDLFETTEAALLVAEFRALYLAQPTPPESLFPGARRALEALAADGFALGVWSNKSQPLCDKIIADLGLEPLFAAVVGTEPLGPLKPDQGGLQTILAQVGGRKNACVLVGDSEVDHAAAAAAGIPLVVMTHGYDDYARPWPGAVLAAHFDDLPAIVTRLLGSRSAAA